MFIAFASSARTSHATALFESQVNYNVQFIDTFLNPSTEPDPNGIPPRPTTELFSTFGFGLIVSESTPTELIIDNGDHDPNGLSVTHNNLIATYDNPRGGVGVSANVFAEIPSESVTVLMALSNAILVSSHARARATASDFVFMPINGPTSGSALTSVNLPIDGELERIDAEPGILNAFAVVLGSFQILSDTGGTLLHDTWRIDITPGNVSFSGLLAGATIVPGGSGGGGSNAFNAFPTSSEVLLPIGVPLTVRLEIEVFISAILDNSGLQEGSKVEFLERVDFLNTFGFATSGPVFNLPDGFTVNSAEFGIVDNQFVGVPEPGTFGLAVLGCFIMTVACFQRRKHSFFRSLTRG
jgi:hypothetical protein